MEERGSEKLVCFLCDYWWVLLIIIVLGLTAYFTRNLWLPLFAMVMPLFA